MAELNELLNKLGIVKQVGDGYQAHCPAHEDKKKSLSIGVGEDGRILLHCHAGCEVADVAAALGHEVKDLFVKSKTGKTSKRIIVARYDYFNAEGELIYQVQKTSSKEFPQRRPDGKGGWVNGLGDVKPVLYRLPEILQAIKDEKPIFVPEGEKDVHSLEAQGLSATTNPMGSGKWKDEYSEALAGASVIVLPDNDTSGFKHAEAVAKSLHGKAASVKVLELPGLPEKGDVTDWLQNGGTGDKLVSLASEAPEWKPGKNSKKKSKKKEKDDEKPVRRTSFLVNDTTLLEQIHVDGKSLFLQYDTETEDVDLVAGIENEDFVIEPIDGEDVELGAVKLPSDVLEYGNTLSLLSDIEKHIYKYLDVSPSYLKFASYYIFLTWLFDRFHTVPYLRALGDTGCGKSRFLDTIGGLAYKNISASGCVTPAPIYRMLRKWNGTLVLDEADMKGSDEYNEVVTILNCGFERGRPVMRCTKDRPDSIQIMPVYGPKVFATRRRFKDAALEARCLTEIMEETDRDIPPVLGRKFFEEQQELRNKLLLFRLRNYLSVNPEAANLDLGNIEPRLKQISESFVALFTGEEEVLNSYRAFIRSHQRELVEQRAASKVGQVVEALFDLMEEVGVTMVTMVTMPMGDTLNVTPGQIAEKVNLTPQAVGQILKSLGLQTKSVKVEGKTQRRVVCDVRKFKKLKKRYIFEEEEPGLQCEAVSHGNVTIETYVTQDEKGNEDDFTEVVF